MWCASWLVILLMCVATCRCLEVAKEDAERNVTLTSDMLDLFNLRRLMGLWPKLMQEEDLIENTTCKNEFEEYFRGLEQQKIWALKSEFKNYVFRLRVCFLKNSRGVSTSFKTLYIKCV